MAYYIEEEAWKCPKHPSKKRRITTGVCSICLRDRLSQLCPYCANVRPCSSNCAAAASTASTSSSSGKIFGGGEAAFCRSKSVGIPFLKSRNMNSSSRRNQTKSEKSNNKTASSTSSPSGKIFGGGEPAFCRSKSVGIPFLKSRNMSSSNRRNLPESEKSNNKTASFWWIFKSSKRGKENESESKAKGGNYKYCSDTRIKEFSMTVMRSRSVNVAMTSVPSENDVGYSPEKLKGWYLVSPMKVFRQSSRAPKLVN